MVRGEYYTFVHAPAIVGQHALDFFNASSLQYGLRDGVSYTTNQDGQVVKTHLMLTPSVPALLWYACSRHRSMNGTVSVVGLPTLPPLCDTVVCLPSERACAAAGGCACCARQLVSIRLQVRSGPAGWTDRDVAEVVLASLPVGGSLSEWEVDGRGCLWFKVWVYDSQWYAPPVVSTQLAASGYEADVSVGLRPPTPQSPAWVVVSAAVGAVAALSALLAAVLMCTAQLPPSKSGGRWGA